MSLTLSKIRFNILIFYADYLDMLRFIFLTLLLTIHVLLYAQAGGFEALPSVPSIEFDLVLPEAPASTEPRAITENREIIIDEADGIASWYGPKFNGRLTANGETYDMYQLTAAHKTLPFNTRLRVTNLFNGKSVEVRINDRGPFLHDRIIDLSKGAAQSIDMITTGTAPVKIDILHLPDTTELYQLQIGAFGERENAKRLLDYLTSKGVGAEIQESGSFYRVIIPNLLRGQIGAMSNKIERLGLGKPLSRKQS